MTDDSLPRTQGDTRTHKGEIEEYKLMTPVFYTGKISIAIFFTVIFNWQIILNAFIVHTIMFQNGYILYNG